MISAGSFFPFCRLLAFLALLPALGTAPAAGAAPSEAPEDRFLLMDADGDGGLSPEEFAAGFPHLRKGAFSVIDADQDGRISREEWRRVRMGHMPAPPESLPAGDPAGGGSPRSDPDGNGTIRVPDLLLPRGGAKP
jgi:hypothetical protein